MMHIQIQSAGRRVLSTGNSFWSITCNGKVIGWASTYANAKHKAKKLEAKEAA